MLTDTRSILSERFTFAPLVNRSRPSIKYPVWPATREMADARTESTCSLTCDLCRHNVGFITSEERNRFALSSGWVTIDQMLERTRCFPCHQASDPAYYARREARLANAV